MQVEMRMLKHLFTKDLDLCDSFKNSFIFVFAYRRDYSNKDVCLHNCNFTLFYWGSVNQYLRRLNEIENQKRILHNIISYNDNGDRIVHTCTLIHVCSFMNHHRLSNTSNATGTTNLGDIAYNLHYSFGHCITWPSMIYGF